MVGSFPIPVGVIKSVYFLEFLFVVKDKLFLDRSVEAFAMSVHLRTARVSVPVGDSFFLACFIKMLFELTAVIAQHIVNGNGEKGLHSVKELEWNGYSIKPPRNFLIRKPPKEIEHRYCLCYSFHRVYIMNNLTLIAIDFYNYF